MKQILFTTTLAFVLAGCATAQSKEARPATEKPVPDAPMFAPTEVESALRQHPAVVDAARAQGMTSGQVIVLVEAFLGNGLGLLNRAWLDHESSAALLHREAEGWDWLGMNLQDGSALTAFQLRRPDGSALWTGGSWRSPPAAGQAWTSRSFTQGELRFTPLRHWTSPLSKARYPTAWKLDTPEGAFEVRALADNQELDSRASTGAIYWEGLSELRRLRADGSSEPVGRGYLEMTGYANALKL